jgi:hypothetical protein
MEPVSTVALAALILASKSSAEEIGKSAGQSTWAGLAKLQALVSRRFRGDLHATQALAQAEQRPEDDKAVMLLREALREYAARDTEFAVSLERLVDDARHRPEYKPESRLFANYGWAGKITIFNAPIHLEHGDFNIN